MRKFAVLFLFLLTAGLAGEDKWIEQIKILMTEQDKADYKKLQSDADKQKFVNEFWAKRDPSPGTPENEYKDNFEKNLTQVNTLMKDKQAFETDMGQTLLLLGDKFEQKEEKSDSAPAYGEGEEEEGAATAAKRVWTYKGLPPDLATGEVKIEFTAIGGQWRFADKKKVQPLLEKARFLPVNAAKASLDSQQKAAKQQQQAAPKPVAGVVPQVSSPDLKAALDTTASGSPPKDIPVNGLVDSFMTSTGETFSTFALQSGGAGGGAKVGIRVLDSSGNTITETELPFVDPTASPAEPAGYFQSNLPLKPGEYSVALALSTGEKSGGVKKTLSVPDYNGKFAVSSLILSKAHQQIQEAKPEKTPYTFGKIKVDPNVIRTFTKSDVMMIVYEAYNFQLDANGKPNLEVVMGFQKGTDKPKLTPPGPAGGLVTGKKITIPTSFELGTSNIFTPGEWKLLVTLTDKISNQTAKQEASFTIQ